MSAMRKRAVALGAAGGLWVLGLGLGAGSARAIVIDDFDATQFLMADSGTPLQGSATLDAGILGGERDELVSWVSGPGAVSLDVDAGGSGAAEIAAGTGTTGAVSFFWDGIDGTPFGAVGLGLGVDLTAGGANALAVEVLSNDLDAVLQINLFSSATAISSLSVPLAGGIASPTVVLFPFASFALGGLTPADLTNVGGIELDLNSDATAGGPTIVIGRVETVTVPEPAAWMLLLPAGGVLLRRRRG